MDRGQFKIWVPRVAAVAGVIACAQIGLVRYTHTERVASLERKLDLLREDKHRSIELLSSQLRSTKAQAQRLSLGLARSREEKAWLEDALKTTQQTAVQLESRIRSLNEALREEPPSLELRLAASTPLERLVAVGANRGPHTIHIAEARGWLWVGGEPPTEDVMQGIDLASGEEVGLFEWRLLGNEPRLLADGSVELRGALCIVYEREFAEARNAWGGEIWFAYQPRLQAVAVVRQDRWQLSPDEVACSELAADRPW